MRAAAIVAACAALALGAGAAGAQEPPAAPPAPPPPSAPPSAAPPPSTALTMDQTVATALQRNRDVIAAKLDIEAAQLERVAAGIYPNPTFSYTLGNIVLGAPNATNPGPKPGPFDQTIHGIGVSEVIDVWNKRGMRITAADRGVELKRLQVEDALRDIVRNVRGAHADVLREQTENQLSHDAVTHYQETIRLSRARAKAGEISEAELRKIELEGLKYTTAMLDADAELEASRARLASLLGLPPSVAPGLRVADEQPPRTPLSVQALTQRAFAQRPDVRANKQARAFADATLASARREAYPDLTLGVIYTHSAFTASGDNPNTLALTLSFPLPIFDRNQAAIGKAALEQRRADNEAEKLALTVAHEVTDAVRREERARAVVDLYESGMLERAETALRTAEKSYKSGAVSLLELLEAQRTYLDTRSAYLRARNVLQQARIDIIHAVGGRVQ